MTFEKDPTLSNANNTPVLPIPSINQSKSIFERCMVCNRKLMVNIKCKCSNHYCEKHRYSHNCTYSYFLENKSNLEKKNQKVEADKIVRL